MRFQFLSKSLLLKGCLHLVFIFDGLSALSLLLGHGLLIALPAHLTHLLLLPQTLLITL